MQKPLSAWKGPSLGAVRNRKGSPGEVTLERRQILEFVHQWKAETAFQAEDTAPSKCML